jgi:hypothetical protein
MTEINWPLLALTACLLLLAVRGWLRRAAVRLVFVRSGDRAGRVALVWFRARLAGYGGRYVWLWLPGCLSRRLWVARATGSGRVARWLRSQGD